MSLPETHRDSPATILVVDDEDIVRHVVCRGLWPEGYRTLEARSGEDAIHLLELSPDLIKLVITDVVMAGMDGWELGRRIGQRWPTVPVLYVSAYEPQDIFHRGPPSRSAPFLQKPFSSEALLTTVRKLLNGHQLAP